MDGPTYGAFLPIRGPKMMPTPPTAQATVPTGGVTPAKPKTPISILVVELIGVSALAFVANLGPNIGRVVTFFMIGILMLWMVTHASALATLVGKV